MLVHGRDVPEEVRGRAVVLERAIPEADQVRIADVFGIHAVGHVAAREHDVSFASYAITSSHARRSCAAPLGHMWPVPSVSMRTVSSPPSAVEADAAAARLAGRGFGPTIVERRFEDRAGSPSACASIPGNVGCRRLIDRRPQCARGSRSSRDLTSRPGLSAITSSSARSACGTRCTSVLHVGGSSLREDRRLPLGERALERDAARRDDVVARAAHRRLVGIASPSACVVRRVVRRAVDRVRWTPPRIVSIERELRGRCCGRRRRLDVVAEVAGDAARGRAAASSDRSRCRRSSGRARPPSARGTARRTCRAGRWSRAGRACSSRRTPDRRTRTRASSPTTACSACGGTPCTSSDPRARRSADFGLVATARGEPRCRRRPRARAITARSPSPAGAPHCDPLDQRAALGRDERIARRHLVVGARRVGAHDHQAARRHRPASTRSRLGSSDDLSQQRAVRGSLGRRTTCRPRGPLAE